MKKIYVTPTNKVYRVCPQNILVYSVRKYYNIPAIQEYESEGGGDGDNDAKSNYYDDWGW